MSRAGRSIEITAPPERGGFFSVGDVVGRRSCGVKLKEGFLLASISEIISTSLWSIQNVSNR